jgi:C-terminal processing protease CtpA/Prc
MVKGRILPIATALLVLCGTAVAGSGAFLGVILGNLDEEIASKLGYEGRGVYVPDVVDEGPAQKAGMKDGDIIVEMDGDKIIGTGHLKDFLNYHAPGDKISVKVWRDGKTKTLSVELGERESELKDAQRTFVIRGEPNAWLGIRMQSLTPQLGEHFGVKKGVLISEVIEESPAKKAGLEAGDVITAIGDEDVEEPIEISNALSDLEPGDVEEIQIVRDGNAMSKKVELAKAPKGHQTTEPYVFMWDGKRMQVPGLEHLYLPKIAEIPIPKLDVPELELEFQEQIESLKEQCYELKALREELKEEMTHLRTEIEELKTQLKESQ